MTSTLSADAQASNVSTPLPRACRSSATKSAPGRTPRESHVTCPISRVGSPPSNRFARFAPAPPTEHEGPLRLLYAGTVGLAQGLDTLVEASRLAGKETVQTTIAGDGADRARVASLAREAGNVEVLGTVPAGQVPSRPLYTYDDADDLPCLAIGGRRDSLKARFRAI